MFELCSAPCKALRFASPALSRGLRALTVPARSSPIGRYVMAGGVNARQPTLAQPTLIIGTAELTTGRARRYSAITSLMPHGIPFTSPDVKR